MHTKPITTQTSYNGWSNMETSLAYLWLSNDEEGCQLLKEAHGQSNEDYKCAEWLEATLLQQLNDEASASLWGDLMRVAFKRVNWVEVIESTWI